MQWFRVWHDMLNDPKWRVIANKSQTRVCEVVSVALAILNSASQNDERGVYTIEAEDIAAALDIDEAMVQSILEAMEGRFICEGKVVNWEKRQPKREDSATERTRAWRERNKTQGDAPVTQCDAPDKIRLDTDTDKKIDGVQQAAPQTTKAKANANNGTSITTALGENPIINAEWANFASREFGWSQARIDGAFAKFVDYWRGRSGAGGRKADWFATWRNWVRADEERTPRGASQTGRAVRVDAAAVLGSIVAARYGTPPSSGSVSGGEDGVPNTEGGNSPSDYF